MTRSPGSTSNFAKRRSSNGKARTSKERLLGALLRFQTAMWKAVAGRKRCMRRPLTPPPNRPNPTKLGDAADLGIRRVFKGLRRVHHPRYGVPRIVPARLSACLEAN